MTNNQVNSPLSSLEKFGALSRKFLHDTSNDFTAIALNIHFLEKTIDPDNPAYKDFQNLALALKNLQQNTRGLLNWRRQLPDPLESIPLANFAKIVPSITDWPLQPPLSPLPPMQVKICREWLESLVYFLAAGQKGVIEIKAISSPNDQCATEEQINLIFTPESKTNYLQHPEIEWSLHQELTKLMGGGIALDTQPRTTQAILFLPLYS